MGVISNGTVIHTNSFKRWITIYVIENAYSISNPIILRY